ncbi:hypothetical protein E2C01_086665 [Portunus trituberculatus]|uniref:Uncharacterized protein n=1 Tax=Portunus trituberculatus TaxID=210409 RepID=A0A5B7JC32_PORTR|nr:hypothetical protein [Portunus trituberculatus]
MRDPGVDDATACCDKVWHGNIQRDYGEGMTYYSVCCSFPGRECAEDATKHFVMGHTLACDTGMGRRGYVTVGFSDAEM